MRLKHDGGYIVECEGDNFRVIGTIEPTQESISHEGRMMTQEEFLALPDVTPGFGYTEQYIDGKRVLIPTVQDGVGALFQKEDDGTVWDSGGRPWITGWINGVRVKRRL